MVLTARDALLPMLSQLRRLASLWPRRLIVLESACGLGSAPIINPRAPSRAAASPLFSAAMLRSLPAPAPIMAITGMALARDPGKMFARERHAGDGHDRNE